MEIILKEDIVNLGYKNDIVTVKSGYGRNYLIPTGKAVIASPAAKKMLAEDLKQRAHKLEKIKKDAEALAAKLEGVSLKIATKVSSTGTIFGSALDIVQSRSFCNGVSEYHDQIVKLVKKNINLIRRKMIA